MDRLFLDANVLFAVAYSPASDLRELWEVPDVELWSSDYAVAEALTNLWEARPDQVPDLKRLAVKLKLHTGAPASTGLPEEEQLPLKDRPILQAAVHVNATHLLTSDKIHFGPLSGRSVGGVLILPPCDYLRSRQRPG
ncbi:MAG: DNA-binding protein [Planctomycetes bacterium]|nr:DNA-binding protein [Planctomycetota bacterium]